MKRVYLAGRTSLKCSNHSILHKHSCQVLIVYNMYKLAVAVSQTIVLFPIAIPPPPSNVKISKIRCRTAEVTWDEVANTTGYTVYWRLLDDNITSQNPQFVNVSGSTSVEITDLVPSSDDAIRQYTVRVTSIRQDDTSEASQDVLFITNSEGKNCYHMMSCG